MSQVAIHIEGRKFLEARLALLPDKVNRKLSLKALKPAAAILKRQAKADAPQGPTGNLKRSIVVRSLRGMPPAVSVYPTYKIAPHKHLIEAGTKARTRKAIGGKFAYLEPNATPEMRSTGRVAKREFFSGAWKATKAIVERTALENTWKVIRGESLKRGAR